MLSQACLSDITEKTNQLLSRHMATNVTKTWIILPIKESLINMAHLLLCLTYGRFTENSKSLPLLLSLLLIHCPDCDESSFKWTGSYRAEQGWAWAGNRSVGRANCRHKEPGSQNELYLCSSSYLGTYLLCDLRQITSLKLIGKLAIIIVLTSLGYFRDYCHINS